LGNADNVGTKEIKGDRSPNKIIGPSRAIGRSKLPRDSEIGEASGFLAIQSYVSY
jgi:hypothetical protein